MQGLRPCVEGWAPMNLELKEVWVVRDHGVDGKVVGPLVKVTP